MVYDSLIFDLDGTLWNSNQAGSSVLFPGVVEGIQKLAEKYALFVVSNCQVADLKRFTELSGLGACFKDMECLGATGRSKGENISALMRRNRLTKAAYIGDSAGDQIAARQAGADFYHAKYGFGSPAQECMGFDSFGEVKDFFLSLVQASP